MGAAADLLQLVVRRDLEFDFLAIDAHHLGFGADLLANGGRGKMLYVDRSADRALARIEIRPDRGQRGVFHEQDHHRRRQHLRQHRVLESVGEMLRLDARAERALGANRNFAHGSHPLKAHGAPAVHVR